MNGENGRVTNEHEHATWQIVGEVWGEDKRGNMWTIIAHPSLPHCDNSRYACLFLQWRDYAEDVDTKTALKISYNYLKENFAMLKEELKEDKFKDDPRPSE